MEKLSNFPDFESQATILFEQWMKDKKSAMRSEDLLLELTHHREIQNGLVEYVSYLADDIPKEFSEELDSLPLFDPKETNKYFTNSRRIQLGASAGMHSPIIEKILQDPEGFRHLTALIHGVIAFINRERENNENLLADVEFFVENLDYIQRHQNDCPKIVLHSMCYTMETLLCAMIEKLLRIIYTALNKNQKEDSNEDNGKDSEKDSEKNDQKSPRKKKVHSLGQYLGDESVKKFFGEKHSLNLQYFLSNANGIGFNIRNELAHHNNLNKEKLTPKFVYLLIWLFTDVLNTTLWHFLKKQRIR